MKSPREIKLENLLTKFIQPVKNIPFEIIIQALFSTKVRKFDLKIKNNKRLLEVIAKAMCDVCATLQKAIVKSLHDTLLAPLFIFPYLDA